MLYKLATAVSLMTAGVYWIQSEEHTDHRLLIQRRRKAKPLTIHVVPHSHDDVGWIVTMDEYFDGSKPKMVKANVKVELTSVVEALLDNPERKFSEVCLEVI